MQLSLQPLCPSLQQCCILQPALPSHAFTFCFQRWQMNSHPQRPLPSVNEPTHCPAIPDLPSQPRCHPHFLCQLHIGRARLMPPLTTSTPPAYLWQLAVHLLLSLQHCTQRCSHQLITLCHYCCLQFLTFPHPAPKLFHILKILGYLPTQLTTLWPHLQYSLLIPFHPAYLPQLHCLELSIPVAFVTLLLCLPYVIPQLRLAQNRVSINVQHHWPVV